MELVSVDSMQVYRGMDIGTAKPTRAERDEVPHHLIDIAGTDEDFSVTRFQAAATVAIEGIEARGHRALLVGGTGLYHRAVIDGLDVPARYPEARLQFEADPDTEGLHRRLADLDPVAAARMEPTNRRRILRALEVTIGSGRPFSSFGPGLDAHGSSRFDQIGVWLPRPVLNARIAERLTVMIEAGLVSEVARLAPTMGRTARQALGYREVLRHLEGDDLLADAVDDATRRTRAFARRQRMWFRRDPRITWLGTGSNPLAVLPAVLRHWG